MNGSTKGEYHRVERAVPAESGSLDSRLGSSVDKGKRNNLVKVVFFFCSSLK